MSTTPATLASVLDAGGPALARALERIEARLAEVTEGHGPSWPATPPARWPRAASGCGRWWSCSAAARATP